MASKLRCSNSKTVRIRTLQEWLVNRLAGHADANVNRAKALYRPIDGFRACQETTVVKVSWVLWHHIATSA